MNRSLPKLAITTGVAAALLMNTPLVQAGVNCVCYRMPFEAGGATLVESPESRSRSPSEENRIEIPDCHIQLVDEVVLASSRTGVLTHVGAKEGDRVEARTRVARVMDNTVQAALATAQARAANEMEVRKAEIASQLAKVEYDSALAANRLAPVVYSKLQITKMRLTAEHAEVQLKLAKHSQKLLGLERDEAEEMLKTYHVEAPFAGIVTRVYKSTGEAVGEGEPILEMCRTGQVRVQGYVSFDQAWRIKQGAAVKVRLNAPNSSGSVEEMSFDGRISFVDPKVQPVAGTVRIIAEVPNENEFLRAGLTATMTIDPDAEQAMKVASRIR